jgi:hypothetical protein
LKLHFKRFIKKWRLNIFKSPVNQLKKKTHKRLARWLVYHPTTSCHLGTQPGTRLSWPNSRLR